jgi:hypothetical protein
LRKHCHGSNQAPFQKRCSCSINCGRQSPSSSYLSCTLEFTLTSETGGRMFSPRD